MIRFYLALPFLLFSNDALGQFLFERQETSINAMSLSFSNYGTVGNPRALGNPEEGTSMRYPKSTGTEHLFEGGLWLGAFVNGNERRVSTSAITNSSGYSVGKAGFEFTADDRIITQTNKTGLGTSEEDLLLRFSDKRRVIDNGTAFTEISGHESPLYADVILSSYNWSFNFTENFSILKYEITNNSHIHSGNDQGFTWDSVFVGQYADIVVRNVLSTQEGGSAFYNKNGVGYLDSLYTTYVFDAGSTDDPSINTYGALTIIGAEYRNTFFHPSNQSYLESLGRQAPSVGPSYWLFSSGTGIFRRPNDDIDRYQRMSEPFPLDGETGGQPIREALRTDGINARGNYISFLSIGPFSEVEPGETITVYMAYSAALKPEEFQGIPGKRFDTEETRRPLMRTLSSLYKVFYGEDANGNGVLDIGEDVNGNGVLDRYLFPTPPKVPKMRVDLDQGKATLYWDKSAEASIDQVSGERDFEGYKIYRSQLGDDVNPQPKVIREYDLADNNFGFNTGFDAIMLDVPKTFEGDSTEYTYAYTLDGLLSGWQYLVSVTAFDRGSSDFNIESLESNVNTNAVRVFPGTPVNQSFSSNSEETKVGVYPNPYRVSAAWDGQSDGTRKIYFTNLPARAEITIFTLAGDVVARLNHQSQQTQDDIEWYDQFSNTNRQQAGGERGWDLQSATNQNITSGLYLFSVKNLDDNHIQRGKFVVLK